MAILDPIDLTPYYKLFPELSPTQTQAVLLMSMGLPVSEISVVKEYSKSRHMKLLTDACKRLNLSSRSQLRTAVQVRVMLGVLGPSLAQGQMD